MLHRKTSRYVFFNDTVVREFETVTMIIVYVTERNYFAKHKRNGTELASPRRYETITLRNKLRDVQKTIFGFLKTNRGQQSSSGTSSGVFISSTFSVITSTVTNSFVLRYTCEPFTLL